MKQLHVLGVMSAVTVLVAVLSVAEEEAPGAGEVNNPLNAVVKLEVTTAKPDIYCPWITRTGGGPGSGVVIDKGRSTGGIVPFVILLGISAIGFISGILEMRGKGRQF